MNPPNSFISNSDRTTLHRIAPAIQIAVWVLIGLITIDILINYLLAYPSDPKVTNPPLLRRYFEYGRSIEGRLLRMTRIERSQTAPITLSGWYDHLPIVEFSSEPPKPIVSFYGMSHAERLGFALGRTSDRFTPRIIAAPGATSNWAYGAYLRDRGGGKSRAVVLAFMSLNFPMITTLSAMTWNLDMPMPYTADGFYLNGNQLRVIHPPYTSFEGYAKALSDRNEWSAVRDFFAENDPMYNSFMMRSNVLDHSSLFRLVRRAYGQRLLRSARKAVLDATGFRPDSEQVKVAHAIVHEFAKQARNDGMIPVIFIINNLGYSDYLYKALRPILDADNIPYLSSHSIVSPDDPRGYLPDSHFADEIDDKLAAALVTLVSDSRQSSTVRSTK
jgi:hypothetical protein